MTDDGRASPSHPAIVRRASRHGRSSIRLQSVEPAIAAPTIAPSASPSVEAHAADGSSSLGSSGACGSGPTAPSRARVAAPPSERRSPPNRIAEVDPAGRRRRSRRLRSGTSPASTDDEPIPSHATNDAVSRWKSPIRSGSIAQADADGVAGPRAEDRRDQEERQPTPARPRMKTYARDVEQAHDDREDERRADDHRSPPGLRPRRQGDAAAAEARARRRRTPPPGRARRPRRACRSRRSTWRRTGPGARDSPRTVAGTSAARWRTRTSARNPCAGGRRSPRRT